MREVLKPAVRDALLRAFLASLTERRLRCVGAPSYVATSAAMMAALWSDLALVLARVPAR